MSVVSIICTVKKFLKVAAADEVPFVRDRIELPAFRFQAGGHTPARPGIYRQVPGFTAGPLWL
jgi:hypothetical protein